MSLLDEIQARCTGQQIANRGVDGGLAIIAAAVSAGRTKPSGLEIGKGAVLSSMGLTAGNAFLDMIDSASDFRHVRGLLSDGRLIVSSPLVMRTIQGFVPMLLTQEQADALLALAVISDPVSEQECSVAMQALS